MSKQTIGWGVVGCGVISPWHLDGVVNTPGTKLVAVCDIIPEKAKEKAAQYSCDYYTDYEEMLKRDDLQVVSICTPSSMHPDMAILAAKYKKNVLTEKPMATTLAKADEMIAACEKAGVHLACIFQRRMTDPFKTIKKAVDEGEIGKIVLGDVYAKYYRSPEYYKSAGWRGTWEFDGGGALMNQCIHMIDMLQYLVGDVEEIYAYTRTQIHQIEVEDTAVAVLKFKNGAVGVIEGTTSVYPDVPHRLELHGSKGTIMVSGEGISRWEVMGPDGKPVNKLTSSEGIDQALTNPTDISKEGHRLIIENLAECVRTGAKPVLPGSEGRKALEIILAIYESNRTGKPVKLPLKA
jgi:UDP-N-acetyl-2-amino-2-deoxyglucuronate dehydrogenase